MPLRFDELSPREFEELCLALLRAEGHTDTRHVGAAGRDYGWDLRTTDPEGRVCCVQCKRKPTLGPAEASRELTKALKYRDRRPFDVWMLMASADVSAIAEDRLAEEAVETSGDDCSIVLVGKSDLAGRIEEHPRVRDRFFAGDDPKARVAYLSAAKADRDLASTLRGDLQYNLRHHVGQNWNVRWHDPVGDQGLAEVPEAASWGIVIVSPEALADRSLLSMWKGALCQGHESGRRRLVAVSVAPSVAWPTWLSERFDRVDLDASTYRVDLAKIVSKWIGEAETDLVDRLEVAEALPRPSRLDSEIHARMVEWLSPVMERAMPRRFLAINLGLDGGKNALDAPEFETPALQASAAIGLARKDDDPVQAGLRVLGIAHDELKDEESADRLADLDRIADDLRASASSTPSSDGPADEGLLSAWLRKVRDDHERLVDYFQRRQELDLLDRVYVELEMSPDAFDRHDLAERKGLRGDSRLGIEDVLALDPDEHSWVTRRWVVRGDPGSGKTTLLRHLAAKLASDASRPWVPIFQSLPALLRDREPLLDRVERSMAAQSGQEGLAAVLDREGQEGRLLLLLDGLDEVDPELREEAEGLLRRLSERWPETPIVISTRPIGYRRFSREFRDLQLLPLDAPRRFEFLASWFGRADGTRDTDRASQAMRQLGGGLDELAGNPLYLTLMAMLLEQGTEPDRNRATLYEQVFQLLLEGKYKHGKPDPIDRPDLVHRVLRLLAYTMTVDNLDTESRSALEERLYREELREVRGQIKEVHRWGDRVRYFLDDLAEKVGILGPHDGEDADWKFWHRTFKEALTAEHLASLTDEERLAQVAELAGQESRWAEPYALVTGQVDDADGLLKKLVKVNRSLGVRALATAQGVSDETLDEILKLTDDLEERSKVLEGLPETVGDAEHAVKLVDRLRQRTRNGFDLFWLDRVAEALAAGDDEHAEAARDLRSRLFDHIPTPDLELFRSFETPTGEAKGLWCEVPAGMYWVGSPEDEDGRINDEVRHQVEIVEPYWMAAIPVTNAQYAAFDPDLSPYRFDGVPDDELAHHPRVNVTWYEAVSFCRWLSTLEGFEGVRLPWDPEWEVACRAGTETAYWSGNAKSDLDRVGWFDENSEDRTHRVAEKPANDFGLYDVHGNAFEWILDPDHWQTFKDRAGTVHPVDPSAKPEDLAEPRARRVFRGGSYFDAADRARSAYRGGDGPGSRWRDLGFRVLLPRPPAGGRS